MAKKNAAVQNNSHVINKIIDEMTLFDDDLMSMVFDKNIPATELLLKTILQREDIKVISVMGQKGMKSPIAQGRSIRLDILVKDNSGKMYNVEVQRSEDGAIERRARFHSSMLDSRMLKKGQKFKELMDSYVIFITETDYFKRGLAKYTIKKYIEESDEEFCDGSHIIYVNGSYKGKDAIGRLMSDFRCKDAKDMYYSDLAKGMKHFKEEQEGRERMCRAVEEYAEEYGKNLEIKGVVETALEYNDSAENIIIKLCKKFSLTENEAAEYYNIYAGATE